MLKNNLLHKEFKIMVIKISLNLGPEWMNTENFKLRDRKLKKTQQLELKNTITKMKNTLKGINGK